jgi:hypothetical protein
MFKRKIKSIVALCIIALMLQGCIFTKKNTPVTTPTGVELSKPLTTTIDFLENFKLAYIAMGNLVGTAHKNGLITVDQFNKISAYAEFVRIEFGKNKYTILSWYDLESKGIRADKQEAANQIVKLLLNHFTELTKIIENEMDLSLQDKQTIESLLNILTLLSGGTK